MPEWLLTLLLAVVAPGGIITGILLYRREAKKAPIDRSDAQVAQALAISTTANALFQTVNAKLGEQDKKLENQDQKIEVLERERDLYVRRLSAWERWYARFVNEWQIHRLKEFAPEPPAREELLT